MNKYIDRTQAGIILAEKLKHYAKKENTIILALPRGGVPVAYQIAKALFLPLDVFIVRKLGMPGYEELAMGALASHGTIFLNKDLVQSSHISKKDIDLVVQKEQKELARREQVYRGQRPAQNFCDKTIILVDDGIATGATMRVAIEALKLQHPKRIIVATPVAAKETYDEFLNLVDEIVCPLLPNLFQAVGLWYGDFPQTSDEEVIALLKENIPAR